jgi:3-phenylpropionate/trans-cinnamate dioxygenase ferredoxin subunit
MGWHQIANLNELSEDEAWPVSIGNDLIAVYKLKGQVYATSNVCTHQFALLSDGIVEDDCVECPLHQACFHVPTGQWQSGPACEPLKTYPVRVEGDLVFVDTP